MHESDYKGSLWNLNWMGKAREDVKGAEQQEGARSVGLKPWSRRRIVWCRATRANEL